MSFSVERKVNGLPLYQNIIRQLRNDLDNGRWKPGDMLPTEVELSKDFDVSVGTMRQAILALVREGHLSRKAGKGTFVTKLDTSRGFGRFFRFREDLRGTVVPTVRHIDTRVIDAGDNEVAEKLKIAAAAPLLRIRRMLVNNEQSICLYVSYLDLSRFGGLRDVDLRDRRLYAVIDEQFGVHVLRAEELLRAGSPSQEEAELLGIDRSTPVMLIDRTAVGAEGSVVEWRRTVGRSDQLYYRIDLP